MYPTISDLIQDLFGIYIPLPIQSFGFMLAIAFLCAAWTLTMELRRKEHAGLLTHRTRRVLRGAAATTTELGTSGLIGFLVGYKIVYALFNYGAFADNPQAVLLSTVGSIPGGLAVGLISAYQRYREKKKLQRPEPVWENEKVFPHQLVGNITMMAALFGILGAKVFHILENLDDFARDPLGSISLFSGLTMYGGLICGGAAVIWYSERHGIGWRHVTDATAPGLMLAYGVGRIGCHVAGDGDWGVVNNTPKPGWLSFLPDWAWAYSYPNNVNSDGIPIPGCEGRHCMVLPEPVWPTPLYEAAACIGLFFILWYLRRSITVPGMLFFVYLVMNGIERFFIEQIRVNTTYHLFGREITQAEIIAVCLVIGGLAGIWFVRRNRKPSTGNA